MTDIPPPIRTLGSREALRTPWLTVREDEIEFADGTRGTYSVVEKPDFVVVLPYEDAGFWLVQEYRHAVGERVWEFAQGGWPAGRDGSQAELAAAELREETGLRAQRLTHLGRLLAAVGHSGQSYDVYLATGLTQGETDREPGEADMICEWRPVADVRAMLAAGEFRDAHSVAALALFDHRDGSRV